MRAATRSRADDKRWVLEVYATFVMRRHDGAWRIVFEQSTPIAGTPRLRPRSE